VQVTKEEYTAKGAAALGAALQQQLRSEGLNPYYIPVGGSSALGVWGYLQAVEEIQQQTQQLGLKLDVIASVRRGVVITTHKLGSRSPSGLCCRSQGWGGGFGETVVAVLWALCQAQRDRTGRHTCDVCLHCMSYKLCS
jgi:hypothetical protein